MNETSRASARAGAVDYALARCEALLADHLSAAVARYGSAALGVVDLPPLEGGAPNPAQIRAAAAMLWARHVDRAGLLEFVDALADGLVHGRLALPLTAGGETVMRYFRDRPQRFDAAERAALYARLFDADFDDQFGRLCAMLDEIDRAIPSAKNHLVVRANVLARQLAQTISDRAVGITAFAARGIVDQIRAALSVMRDPDVTHAFGGLGVWLAIKNFAPTLLGRSVDPQTELDRAAAGLTVLEWLARNSSAFDTGREPIDRDRPVLDAAERWQAAAGSP